MTTYELIKPKNKSKGYGLKATKVIVYEDIAGDYEAVKNLVDTCNRCDVDLDFFPDILENYLTDYTF
jgi:hypothetical protein